MLTKLTSKNQLALSNRIDDAVGRSTYSDVTVDDGLLVLTPPQVGSADGVRSKLAELRVDATDIRDALDWARGRR
jgi:hypothetical protein